MPKIAKINNKDGSTWYGFFCPGCECGHHFTNGWTFNGDMEKPTVSPSLLTNANLDCPTEPRCHLFIKDGRIEFLSDCTHALAGQTVEMSDY